MTNFKFPVGTPVQKIGGYYQADGTIVAAFTTLAGEPRYVFEFVRPKGMLHIFGPSQLKKRDEFHCLRCGVSTTGHQFNTFCDSCKI